MCLNYSPLIPMSAPTISLSMGEKGQITRLLSNKFGGYLTFAALSPEKASAPGQPTISQLDTLYNFKGQSQATKLFGIIGNPVSHSRSPLIHNTAFQHIGFDGVYVPLLVDDLGRFLEAFGAPEFGFQGFSVTIPHKVGSAMLVGGASSTQYSHYLHGHTAHCYADKCTDRLFVGSRT